MTESVVLVDRFTWFPVYAVLTRPSPVDVEERENFRGPQA